MEPYKKLIAQPTQSIKPSDSINIGGDGILFTLMLAVVVGMFLFKGKREGIKSNVKNEPNPSVTIVSEKAHVEHVSLESHASDMKSAPNNQHPITDAQLPLPNAQCLTPNDQVGQRIIDELVHTKLSTLLAAPSGAGKSVTQSYWLTKLFEKYPIADVYVIARKNDSFNGLSEKGKVWVYDSSDPTIALEAIEKVYEIFLDRSQLPEGAEREKLKSLPVRLILSDWYSTHNSLTKSYKKLWDAEIQTKLADIVTVAREFNVSLFADSQTYNIASLGLAEDSNIRNNLNIISQGLISYDEDGNEQGGFEVVQSIVRNPYIFPDSQLREKFIGEVSKYVKLSAQSKVPLIISTSGKPKVGLLPNLVEYKGKKIQDTQNKVSIPQDVQLTAALVLPEQLRVIWSCAQEKQGEWLAVRDIARKDYAALKGRNTATDITKFVEQLAEMGLLEINRDGQAIRFGVNTD